MKKKNFLIEEFIVEYWYFSYCSLLLNKLDY